MVSVLGEILEQKQRLDRLFRNNPKEDILGTLISHKDEKYEEEIFDHCNSDHYYSITNN